MLLRCDVVDHLPSIKSTAGRPPDSLEERHKKHLQETIHESNSQVTRPRSLATLVRYSKTLDLGIEPEAPHARQFAQLTSAVLGTVRSRTAYSGGRSDPSGSSDVSVSSTSKGPGLGFATRSSAMGTAVLGLAESLCPACASFLPRCCSARAELHETHNTCFLPHHEKLPRSS